MNDLSQPATTVKCWVELYSDKMYTWALYKTGAIEVAEDLVQDTFLAAFWNYRSDGRQIEVSGSRIDSGLHHGFLILNQVS